MFRSNRLANQRDIDELKDDIVRIDGNIDTLNARIDDRVRLRVFRNEVGEVNKDIRSLVDKIEKNKDFIFLAADCNNPGPDVNPVCSRIRQPRDEADGEEEQVGGRRKRKSRKKRVSKKKRKHHRKKNTKKRKTFKRKKKKSKKRKTFRKKM
tara:strand:- start:8 stop:463 length:456 start_codon:yes stop_codon:yes gene_type:complete